jgi:hypothetical protein
MSPNRLNKSVSFSQQVKVREFPSSINKRKDSPIRNVNATASDEYDIPARRLSYQPEIFTPSQQHCAPLYDNHYGGSAYS